METASATVRRWGGLTAHERHERRREQLLEAGLEVFGTHGWAGTTVRDIVRTASLSQRYFYEVFTSREQCFLAVLDRTGDQVSQVVAEAIAVDGIPVDRARETLTGLADYFTSDPRRLRVAFVESFATPEFRERRAALLAGFAALASRLMVSLHDDPEMADRASLERSAYILSGGVAEALVAWVDGHQPLSADVLVDHLTSLYAAATRLA